MKYVSIIILFFFLNLNSALPQCSPNSIYLSDTLGFYGDNGCGNTVFTFSSVVDSTLGVSLVPGTPPTQITYYMDAFRIESIQGVPAGLVISTDVIWSSDNDAPYGYWYNDGSVPNQTPIVGCLSFSGDPNLIASLLTGGPNNDGVYPIVVNLDSRIAGTQPNLSTIVQPGTWSSATPTSLGLGLFTYQLSLHVGTALGGITASSVVSGASCVSGSAEITVSGASLPLTYSVDNSNPITTPTNVVSLANLGVGQHNVSITDDNGCSITEVVQIDGIVPYQGESLCIVSVDSVSGENLLVWEKTTGVFTESFNVYKQNNLTSGYDLIGSVSIGSLSTYLDAGSSPQQGSDRYKISVVDDCGVESGLSASHRNIHLSANQGINGEVNLSWNAYEGFNYPNFEIYRSNSGNPYVLINNVANNSFSYTDLAPPAGINYYKVAVANPNGCNPTRSVLRSYSNVIDETGGQVSIYEGRMDNEKFVVYPNPSNGVFQVDGAGTLTVYNSIGQNILTKEIQGRFVLDLGAYPNGVYSACLKNSKSVSTVKLLKD